MGKRLLVLGWHNIDPTPGFPDPPGAGRRGFARQLAVLARWASVIPLRRALDLMDADEPLPPRAVALTFDDGYRDNLELGVPMLARHDLPATFYLVPGFLDGTVGAWWEDLSDAFDRARAPELTWRGSRYGLTDPAGRAAAHDAVRAGLKRGDHASRVAAVAEVTEVLDPAPSSQRPLFLDWDGARALRATGHDLGSHTVSHAILERETPQAQAAELADSRAALERVLGPGIDTVAYPNGSAADYSEVTTAAAAAAGYRCAVTTRAGLAARSDDRYELRRVVVTPTTDLASVAGKVWRKARTGAPRLLRRVAGRS